MTDAAHSTEAPGFGPLAVGNEPRLAALCGYLAGSQAIAFLKGEPVKTSSPTVAQSDTPKPQAKPN